MELGAAFDVLRRRRWVLVAGVLVVVAALGAVATSTRPQFQVTNTVLLTPPVANPYLDVTAALDVLARGTGAQTADQAVSSLLARNGTSSLYTIGPEVNNTSALVVTVTDTDAAAAVRTALAVDNEIRTVLVARQRFLAVPAKAFIGSRRFGDPVVQRFNKSRNRLLAVGAGGGLVGTLLASFALEGLALRRKANRMRSRAQRRAARARMGRRVAAGGAALLVLGAAGAMALRRAPPWQASTTIELIPPQFPPNPELPPAKQGVLNPFQSFDSSYDIVSELVADRATSDSARASLARQGIVGGYQIVNYTIGANPVDTTGNPTPLLEVTSTSAYPATAERTVAAVAAALSKQVEDLQAATGAPRLTWMTTSVVTPPAAAQLHTSRTRGLVALGTLAFVGAVAAGRAFDRLSLRLAALWRPRLARLARLARLGRLGRRVPVGIPRSAGSSRHPQMRARS